MNDSIKGRPAFRVLFVEPRTPDAESLRDLVEFDAEWVVDTDGKLQASFKTVATPHVFLVHEGKVLAAGRAREVTSMISDAERLSGERVGIPLTRI